MNSGLSIEKLQAAETIKTNVLHMKINMKKRLSPILLVVILGIAATTPASAQNQSERNRQWNEWNTMNLRADAARRDQNALIERTRREEAQRRADQAAREARERADREQRIRTEQIRLEQRREQIRIQEIRAEQQRQQEMRRQEQIRQQQQFQQQQQRRR